MKPFFPTISLLVFLASAVVAADQATPKPGTILSGTLRTEEWFRKNCVMLQDPPEQEGETSTCAVNVFSPLGRVEDMEIYYALYRQLYFSLGESTDNHSIFDESPYNNTAVVILKKEGMYFHPLFAEINSGYLGVDWFLTPEIALKQDKELIQINIGIYRGHTQQHFYRFNNSKWSLYTPKQKQRKRRLLQKD